eukprot:7255314-Prymnesium_polylepis.2
MSRTMRRMRLGLRRAWAVGRAARRRPRRAGIVSNRYRAQNTQSCTSVSPLMLPRTTGTFTAGRPVAIADERT